MRREMRKETSMYANIQTVCEYPKTGLGSKSYSTVHCRNTSPCPCSKTEARRVDRSASPLEKIKSFLELPFCRCNNS